ncbi:MAG TPA: ATP-binding protein [Steroidobacteraceae bacterium]|nr:ATP-binding protein [Steroidobacteraceae bacterium]
MLSSELVRSVLDSAPDAMVIIDASGSIVFANRQLSALFGYEASEVTGRGVEILLPTRFRHRHVEHRRSYAESVRVRPMGMGLDLFALRKDGTEFPVEISLSPIAHEPEPLVAAAIRDVTDRRSIEMKLKEAQETAERASQAKSRFLATASHDLRQPLQTLALLNGAMRRVATNPELVEALAQEEQAIGAMSRLLNALLDISKLESGAIKPEVTDFEVARIFAELRSEFASLAAEKGLRLSVEPCTDRVQSDPSLVGQVLRNLVSNAIKYTREGCVRLRCLHDEASVRVEVVDTGIGIPAHALAHIFDEFYQVGVATNTSRQGYGLGLSIVHRIVELLGLRLDVRSELGKGSTFSLQLPASRGQADVKPRGMSGVGTSANPGRGLPRVLLVEDDPAVRNATRMLLRVEGYEVSTAGSLDEALRQAAEHPDIELLVTDYHLANQETGIQAIASMRKHLAPDLRAVLITGDTSSAVRDLERDDHLRVASKPINADELLSLLRELVAA